MQYARRVLRRLIWKIFALWLVIMAVIGIQCYVTSQTLERTEQLATQIEELHKVFSFDLVHRLKYAAEMADQVDRIEPSLYQLKIASNNNLFAPDTTQLIYVTQRFVEDAVKFLGDERELLSLSEDLYQNTYKDTKSSEVAALYDQLARHLFIAMFSESVQSRDIYQTLDELLARSNDLETNEKVRFQEILAKTSSVLSQYAQEKQSVARLHDSTIFEELATTHKELHDSLLHSLIICTLGTLALAIAFGVVQLSPADVKRARRRARVKLEAESEKTAKPKIVTTSSRQVNVNKYIPETQPANQEDPVDTKKAPRKAETEYVDVELMLDSLGGELGAVKMLLNVFIDDHSGDWQRFENAFENDRSHAQRIVHSLKGVSGTIGAAELNRAAVDVETCFKQEQEPSASQLEALESSLTSTLNYVKQLLDSPRFIDVSAEF